MLKTLFEEIAGGRPQALLQEARKMTKTIDITPTWQAFLAADANGSFEGVKIAEEELVRMADVMM